MNLNFNTIQKNQHQLAAANLNPLNLGNSNSAVSNPGMHFRNSNISVPLNATASTNVFQQLFALPSRFISGVKSVAANISDFSDAAKNQRIYDQNQGIGLFQGSQRFSQNVAGFYQHLGSIDLSKLNREQIIPHLGAIAQSYMQEQAGAQIFSALENNFPETMNEISQVVGVARYNGAQAGSGVTTPGQMISPNTLPASNFAKVGSKIMGWVGAAYSIYEIFKGKLDPSTAALSGAAAGAYIGSSIAPGVGTLIGAAIGGVGGFISGLFKSGKPADQKERDSVRNQLQAAGILDSEWMISLANGAKFDMGKDGGARLINKDGTERRYKEFDMSNPITEVVAQIAAPLAQALAGNNQRLTGELTAYLTNAATSNGDSIEVALQNLQAIYGKFGVPLERVLQKLN